MVCRWEFCRHMMSYKKIVIKKMTAINVAFENTAK
jgi:hypothetical protein